MQCIEYQVGRDLRDHLIQPFLAWSLSLFEMKDQETTDVYVGVCH